MAVFVLYLYFGACLHFLFLGNGVGHHHSLEGGAVDARDGRTGENAVCEDSVDLYRTSVDEPERNQKLQMQNLRIIHFFSSVLISFYDSFSGTDLSAAWQMVPQVSAMSSTRMATRSLTSPTRTMRSTSLAFFLSLWMRAKSTFRRSAMDVTLDGEQEKKTLNTRLNCTPVKSNFCASLHHRQQPYRFAPPASGDTIIQFFHSGIFSLIHFRTAGSA